MARVEYLARQLHTSCRRPLSRKSGLRASMRENVK